MSTGTRDGWTPEVWPSDQAASSTLKAWLDEGDGAEFYGLDLDFGKADLSRIDLADAWLTGSTFGGTVLRNAQLVHAHCEGTNFAVADLMGADLTGVVGHAATFSGARLVGADLNAAEFWDADFSRADLTGANLGDGSFARADLRGASLRKATADKAILREASMDSVEVAGMTGSVIGPIKVTLDGEPVLIDDDDLVAWFRDRGATVERFRRA